MQRATLHIGQEYFVSFLNRLPFSSFLVEQTTHRLYENRERFVEGFNSGKCDPNDNTLGFRPYFVICRVKSNNAKEL